MNVSDIMTRPPTKVQMDDTLRHVKALFDEHRFHHLLVVDGGRIVGVVSDRDLLKHISPFAGSAMNERPQDAATLNKHVHQVMTRKPVTAPADLLVAEAAKVMLEHDISCLPVLDPAGKPLGIVTSKDLLRALVV